MTGQQRLDDMPDKRLRDQKQSGSPQHHCPIRPDRRREDERKYRGNRRPDVRHKTQDHRQYSPQRGAGNTDEPQSRADHETETCVEGELSKKEATESLTSIVQRCCRALKILGAS